MSVQFKLTHFTYLEAYKFIMMEWWENQTLVILVCVMCVHDDDDDIS